MDEIIKRRLLIDGDGTGDDRRITALHKSVIQFCRSQETPDECEVSYRRLRAQLNQLEYTLRRSAQNVKTNMATKKGYQDLDNDILEQIEQTKQHISESNIKLEEAMKHRKRFAEYDAMANLIQMKPDRRRNEVKVDMLTKDQEELQGRRDRLRKKLDQRRRTMTLMASEVTKLQEMTREDDEVKQSILVPKNGVSDLAQSQSPAKKIVKRIGKGDATAATSGEQIPIESNDTDYQLNHTDSSRGNIRGTITSAPLSPIKPGNSENYEDLSDEEDDLEGGV